jgi:hypothetical protein
MGSLRHPRTTQERRRICGDQADSRYDPMVPEIHRKRRYIPHAWDDIWSEGQRCWKKYRKTQWREKLKRKKPPAKFRGHLNPRWQVRSTKTTWHWDREKQCHSWCYFVIWYCEATGERIKIKRTPYDWQQYRSELEYHGIRRRQRYYSIFEVDRVLSKAKAAEDHAEQGSNGAVSPGFGEAAESASKTEETVTTEECI